MEELKGRKIKVCYVASVDITLKFILLNHLKFLINEGYEVSAVCSPGRWIKDIEKEGIKVKIIRIKRKISPVSDLVSFIKLFFYFRKERIDVVHAHTPKASLIGQLAAKMAGVPIIVNTIHGLYFKKDDSWIKRKLFILVEKILAQCSNLIFLVNREDMGTVVKEKICPADLIRYIGGGVNMALFNPRRFSEEFVLNKKKQLGIDPKRKIIGIVARLVKEKGYLDLFNSFKIVLERFPDTLLLIVGSVEPEKRDAISPGIIKKYKIGKNVIFLGERANIEEIYLLMDIFALPSYREGLGISILDAQAMEKPVVATKIRGIVEAVDGDRTGLLVSVGNSRELARALIFLLENPEKAKEMGKNGRIKVINEFDEKLVFERIRKEYQRLIKEKLI